jgi:hypothetical protein
MLRSISGVAAGFIAWMLVATLGNIVLRMAWPGYSEAESEMRFTTAMMLARLLLGVAASLAAGLTCSWITRRNNRALIGLAGILLIFFVPVHYRLWETFPLWYHVAFLISLVVVTPLGARLLPSRASRVSGDPAQAARDRAV